MSTVTHQTLDNSNVIRILVVRLSSLGDIVHTFPMIQDIKDHFPNSKIDWLVDNSFKELVELNPNINNIITIPLRFWLKSKISLFSNFKKWKNTLVDINYDYIIDTQGLFKSAVLTKSFQGPVYGLDKNSVREKLATYFYLHKIYTGKNLLAIQKNRLLASKIFNYSINMQELNFGLKPTSNHNTSKYVIFFHATSKDSKKYPIHKWVELAKYLIQKHDLEIVVPYGNDHERFEAEAIKNQLPEYVDLIKIPKNKLSYADLAKLINEATFIFGVDTGLVHLANALNKKLIAIYTDTNPARTGVFETKCAKNIGSVGIVPEVNEIINLFESILKI